MNFRIKSFLLLTVLAIIFSCFTVKLYADNMNSSYLGSSSDIINHKELEKTNKNKLALIESNEIIEEDTELENWMFNSDFFTIINVDENQIEPWMLDREFFKIHKPFEFNEEIIEEESEIEEWMLYFCPLKCSGSGIYTNYLEKEWVKKQNSLIL